MHDHGLILLLFLGLPLGIPIILLRELWLKVRGVKDVDIEKLAAMGVILLYSGMGTSLLILALAVVGLTRLVFGV